MHRIIIDDNKLFATSISNVGDVCYTSEIYPLIETEPVKIYGKTEIRELAEAIINNGISDNDVLFINLNLRINYEKRQELIGVELLIWLRINGVSNPSVLYSFDSINSILKRQLKNLILLSKGVYFIQLPNSLKQLDFLFMVEKVEESNLKEFLNPAFSVENIKHREANWWGLKQLCDIHYALNNDFSYNTKAETSITSKSYYPLVVNTKLLEFNNNVAAFIYNQKIEDISAAFKVKEVESFEKEIFALNEEITEKKPKKGIETASVGQRIWHWKETIKVNSSYKQELEKAEGDRRLISKKIDELEEKKRHIHTNEGVLKILKDIKLPKILPGIKMIYIDDKANDGWSELLCNIFYGQNKHNNFVVIDCINNDEKKLSDIVLNSILNQKTDIVLLDLRLRDEIGKMNLESLGGYILLKEIKERFPGLPVIITSATKDGYTIKALLKNGAENVWTKPGIDEKLSTFQVVERYMELPNQVYSTLTFYENIDLNDKEKIFKKLEFIKYRLQLYNHSFDHEYFKLFDRFTDIIVDTNFLIQQNQFDEKGNQVSINVVESICNLYILAYITTNHFSISSNNRTKVMIMNVIIDEIIKHSKNTNADQSKAAQFAYSIIMEMFSDGIVQTEYTYLNNRGLKNPKENVYADGFILDEIGSYLISKKKKFGQKGIQELADRSLLLITNDKDLTIKAEHIGMGKKLEVWNITKLNSEMNKITL